MKTKYFFPLVLAIIIGFLSARIVYALYNNDEKERFNAYFLEVKANDSNFIKQNMKVNSYIVVKKNNKDTVYCAITTKINNLNKIKKIYDLKGIKTNIKKIYIDNKEFMNNLEQYDILLNNTYKESDLISITKVILSSYDEMVLND